MVETKQPRLEQPLLYLRLQIARIRLEDGDLPSCAKAVDEGRDELESLHDVSLPWRFEPPIHVYDSTITH